MEVQFRFIDLAQATPVPSKAHPTDAGFDITATSVSFSIESNCLVYGTNLAVDIPAGYVGLMFPRSSVYKKNLSLANCVGVIDSGYHGEIKFLFKKGSPDLGSNFYNVGDKIGQLVIIPIPEIELTQVYSDFAPSDRGDKGFGSTGN